jgi:tetratricopeptide (TPR) repeat protein
LVAVLAGFAVLPPAVLADVCQPCTQQPGDPKMHGRSLKSYWGIAKGDQLVLAKAFEQGHLALCGAPDQWEWNMFMGMVSSELGNHLTSRKPVSEAQAESLRTAALQKLEMAGCYFNQALKHAQGKDKEKVLNNRDHYWVEQYNEAINFYKQDALVPALERLDMAILVDPSNCKGYGLKGPTLIKLERYEEAVATLEKGHAVCPSDSTITTNLFAAVHNFGNQIFNRAANAKGDSAKMLYNQALVWYKKSAEIDPKNVDNLYQMGVAHLRLVDLGDKDSLTGARQYLEAFLAARTGAGNAEELEDRAKALYYLTWIEVESKDWAKAEGYVDQYLALAPREAEGYRFKSIVIRETKGPAASEPYIIFFTAINKGKAVEDVGKWVQSSATSGDLGKVIKEKGNPEEVHSYTDSSGNRMVSAFYWSKGEGFAFYGDQKRGTVTFQAKTP